MLGKIKAYSEVVSAGVIIGTDNKEYTFYKNDWTSTELPINDMSVAFESFCGEAKKVKAK